MATRATSPGAEAKRAPGRPPKSAEARAQERASILSAAREAIRATGPTTSLDEIAAAAGVGKPKIYAHFGDKAGLGEALAIEQALQLEAFVIQTVDSRGSASPEEVFRIGIDAFTTFMAEDTNLYRFLVHSIKAAETEVFDNALLLAFQSRTEDLILLVRPSLDKASRELAAYGTLGQIFAACEGWLQHRRFSREQLVDLLVTLVVHGITALDEA